MNSNRILLAYVGLKEAGESAFHHLTGLTWFPGSVHEVEAAHASQMLAHPDVFARADAGAAAAIGNTTGPASVSTGGDGTTGDTDPLASAEFQGLGAMVGKRAIRETDAGDEDTSGISLTPGATVAAPAPAPAAPVAPAAKTTTKAKAK